VADKEYEFFERYFKALIEDFETIDDRFAAEKKDPINLERAYITLKLRQKKTAKETSLYTEQDWNPQTFAEKQKVQDYRPAAALRNYRRLLVTGPPGAGKTMMLKYLTFKICKENLENRERNKIPIFVALRNFIKSKKDLRAYLNDIFASYGCPKAKKIVEKALEQGQGILLLDGYDELFTKQDLERVSQEIQNYTKKYGNCRVILTSRYTPFPGKPPGFIPLELAEFDNTRIKKFLHIWFGPATRGKADELFHFLMNNKNTATLARTPLLLSMIAALYDQDESILHDRPGLYERIVHLILEGWDAHKQTGSRFPLQTKKNMLKKLAYYNHSLRQPAMTEKDIIEVIERHASRFGFEKKKSALLFEEIWQRSNILKPLFKGVYQFSHNIFRFYFTALELIDREYGIDTIDLHISDPWWEEPILLYAGIIKDAKPLIEIIKRKKPEDIFYNNLMLAGKCIAEAPSTDLFLKREISRELWHIANKNDFQLLKERATAVLARLKPPFIIDELVNRLTDKEVPVRQFAADTLGLMGGVEVLPALIMVLVKDYENKVRGQAAAALGKTGRSEAVQPLIHVLSSDKAGEVRGSAAAALGNIGSSETLPALIKTLTIDHDSNVRGAAVEAIGEIGSTEPIPQLVRALSNEIESSVRWRIAMAIGKLQGSDARDLLIEALDNDKDKEVRESAAEGLALVGSEECIPSLIKALSFDNEADVRGSAAYALGLIKSKEALPALIRALITDKQSEVRGRAAFALGRIKNAEAVPYLIAVFNSHKESIIRGNAAYAIGEIGGEEAIPFLIQALTLDKDAYVRYRAAEVLGSIGNTITIQPLKTALEDEGSYYGWKVKDKAYEALEKVSKRCHVRITRAAGKGF
jgi:HEAT repeat protein